MSTILVVDDEPSIIEVLEIVLDGVFGSHRLFAPLLGSFYNFLINTFCSNIDSVR